MVGGWADDYAGTGMLVRPAAEGAITAYLRESGDVILPQLIAREAELTRFEGAATNADAAFVHVRIVVGPATAVARFDTRADEAHSRAVRELVAAEGGPGSVVTGYDQALDRLPGLRLDGGGDLPTTYAALVAMLDR
jgi:hypothetical protein